MASNRKVVPECHKALDQMKYEIAAELGLPVGYNKSTFGNVEFATELGNVPASSIQEDYWGHIASRDAGAVGGAITSRLVKQAEQVLFGLQ
ncbi:hypothetical protein GCM10020370_66560 [Paenibacillus hodogayensis]